MEVLHERVEMRNNQGCNGTVVAYWAPAPLSWIPVLGRNTE